MIETASTWTWSAHNRRPITNTQSDEHLPAHIPNLQLAIARFEVSAKYCGIATHIVLLVVRDTFRIQGLSGNKVHQHQRHSRNESRDPKHEWYLHIWENVLLASACHSAMLRLVQISEHVQHFQSFMVVSDLLAKNRFAVYNGVNKAPPACTILASPRFKTDSS